MPCPKLRVQIDWRVTGFVVYIMVVNQELKKAGTTGRKNSTFEGRMHSTFGALRQVITGGPPNQPPARWRSRRLDPFKQHAAATILAGHEIELWAPEYPSLELMLAKEGKRRGPGRYRLTIRGLCALAKA